jgi:putative NADH-flavin reductase
MVMNAGSFAPGRDGTNGVRRKDRALRLLILGATGGIGRLLVDQARERGYQVSAFVRSPEKIGGPRDSVMVRQGDPRNVSQLIPALAGHDAVLSVLGPVGTGPTTILRESARSTIDAMRATQVQRLLIVSAAMLFEDAGLVAALLRTTLLKNVADDSAEMERIVSASDLDWTIARPPRLTNGRLSGRYRVEDGHLPSGGRSMSRADVAQFLLNELETGAHVHQIVGMAG